MQNRLAQYNSEFSLILTWQVLLTDLDEFTPLLRANAALHNQQRPRPLTSEEFPVHVAAYRCSFVVYEHIVFNISVLVFPSFDLSWGEDVSHLGPFDLVLVSDCVYDISTVSLLRRALQLLVRPGVCALLSWRSRRPDVPGLVRALLEGFTVQRLSAKQENAHAFEASAGFGDTAESTRCVFEALENSGAQIGEGKASSVDELCIDPKDQVEAHLKDDTDFAAPAVADAHWTASVSDDVLIYKVSLL